jgi:hypothetical protein
MAKFKKEYSGPDDWNGYRYESLYDSTRPLILDVMKGQGASCCKLKLAYSEYSDLSHICT